MGNQLTKSMDLNFKVFGAGEPVIILHGMFGTLDNWQTIAKKLANNFMVFIVDLRNHGRSPHSDDFNYSIMSEDLREFMENNWIYKATIIGHSMGGKVAMQFASDNPDMINKLVIIDIAPKTYKGNHTDIFDSLFALDLDNLKSRKEADNLLAQKIESYTIRQFILKNLYLNKKTKKYNWKMNLPVIFKAYDIILSNSELSEPFLGTTLFIKGSKSPYIDDNEFERYKKHFPSSSLVTIKDAGHWVHADQANQLLTILKKFC
ncbi:MAG: alpha/beta fold hydrolase [Saprospiraceae bacterium]|nr:alpha/beta fold hydrolase [Saprospiraceae bacterium]